LGLKKELKWSEPSGGAMILIEPSPYLRRKKLTRMTVTKSSRFGIEI